MIVAKLVSWQINVILHYKNPRFWIKTLHNLQGQRIHFFSLKNSFLWGFLAEGTRIENNGKWKFQDRTKRLFFFPSQTPESSLGYKYWIS